MHAHWDAVVVKGYAVLRFPRAHMLPEGRVLALNTVLTVGDQ